MTIADPPARGTRPANRRDLILTAAGELFATRGYAAVSIGDIADAVAVGPSALYRHFRSKEQLLVAVTHQVADELATAIDQAPPADTLALLARLTLDHRSAGVLLRREARHLPEPDRAALRARLAGIRAVVAARLGSADLTTAALTAAMTSPSYHRAELPRPAYEALLAELAERILRVPAEVEQGTGPRGLGRTSRREVLLEAALQLFSQRTFASVSMEEIASAAGISASSVYTSYSSKLDLLGTAMQRGNGYLQVSLSDTLSTAADPAEALRGLIATYAQFARAHPHYVDVLINETRSLPAVLAADLVQSQRDFVGEWQTLLLRVDDGLDPSAARIKVQAVLTVIHELGRRGDSADGGRASAAYLQAVGESMLLA